MRGIAVVFAAMSMGLGVMGLGTMGAAQAQEVPPGWQAPPQEQIPNHRAQWREVVVELATYAKARNKNFIVLAHGGLDLMVKGEREGKWEELQDPDGKTVEKRLPVGSVMRSYVKVLDGAILDGLYCGYNAFDKSLDQAVKAQLDLDKVLADERARGIHRPPVPMPMGPFSLDPQEEIRRAAELRKLAQRDDIQRRTVYAYHAMRESGRRLLSLETCADAKGVSQAMSGAGRDRVLPFAAIDGINSTRRVSGRPPAENSNAVATVGEARNWMPQLHGNGYGSKTEWVEAMAKTNYDMLVMDVSYRGQDPLTKDDVKKLKFKELGAPRLVLAVLPVGKAFDWRWYWKKDWVAGNPDFLFAPISDDPGAYMASVDNAQWRAVLGKYITGIVDLGFDGVVLDDLDTYLWFESLMPLDE